MRGPLCETNTFASGVPPPPSHFAKPEAPASIDATGLPAVLLDVLAAHTPENDIKLFAYYLHIMLEPK